MPAGTQNHFSRGGHQAKLITHSAWANLKIPGLKKNPLTPRMCGSMCISRENRKLERCRKRLRNSQQSDKEPQFLHNPIERETEGVRTEVKKLRLMEGEEQEEGRKAKQRRGVFLKERDNFGVKFSA